MKHIYTFSYGIDSKLSTNKSWIKKVRFNTQTENYNTKKWSMLFNKEVFLLSQILVTYIYDYNIN